MQQFLSLFIVQLLSSRPSTYCMPTSCLGFRTYTLLKRSRCRYSHSPSYVFFFFSGTRLVHKTRSTANRKVFNYRGILSHVYFAHDDLHPTIIQSPRRNGCRSRFFGLLSRQFCAPELLDYTRAV